MHARFVMTLTVMLMALWPALAAHAAQHHDSKAKAKEQKQQKQQKEATPKDQRVWSIVKVDDAYVLRFGLPRAPDPVFALACQKAAKLLQVTVETASPRIRSGDGVALVLGVGKKRVELAATAFRAATEGRVVVETAVALNSRIIDLLSEGETLVVRLPGANESYPLAGARPRLGDFRKACL